MSANLQKNRAASVSQTHEAIVCVSVKEAVTSIFRPDPAILNSPYAACVFIDTIFNAASVAAAHFQFHRISKLPKADQAIVSECK